MISTNRVLASQTRIARLSFFALLADCLLTGVSHGQKSGVASDDEVRAVIVLARHGVRAPIESEIRASSYNAQPWPAWPVNPGVLTEHGTHALKLLGEYYRTRYPSLLQQPSCGHPRIYTQANTTQRTIASGKALLTGLAPQCPIEIHSRPPGQPNPLFSAPDNGSVDHQELTDATNGRMGDRPEWFAKAFSVPLAEMHHVLMDCSGKDCDKTKPDFRSVMVREGVTTVRSPRVENPVTLGADFAEHFLLEYTEGMPMGACRATSWTG